MEFLSSPTISTSIDSIRTWFCAKWRKTIPGKGFSPVFTPFRTTLFQFALPGSFRNHTNRACWHLLCKVHKKRQGFARMAVFPRKNIQFKERPSGDYTSLMCMVGAFLKMAKRMAAIYGHFIRCLCWLYLVWYIWYCKWGYPCTAPGFWFVALLLNLAIFYHLLYRCILIVV